MLNRDKSAKIRESDNMFWKAKPEVNVPITIEYEDFLEAENSDATCRECKYHI